MKLLLHAVLTSVGLGFAAPIRAADWSYFESDWGSDWSMTVLYADPGSSSSVITRSSGGNPGPYREVTLTSGDGSIIVAHTTVDSNFDPAVSGAIESLDFSIDILPDAGTRAAQGFGPVVMQDGRIFFWQAEPVTGFYDGWFSSPSYTSLKASDFVQYGHPGIHPDFGSDGAILSFGFLSLNYLGNANVTGFDNLALSITTVPEPGCFELLVAGITLAALTRLR
ncbi:MAG: hypothetical protein JNL87_18845 [Burkholderiaceae bacterium]|nr:hypothetical protein [Burkholderiaceae bacterium]